MTAQEFAGEPSASWFEFIKSVMPNASGRALRLSGGAFLLCATVLNAAELKPETLVAWDKYVQRVQDATGQTAWSDRKFLLLDANPESSRLARQGEVVVSQIKTAGSSYVPHGLIHHWVGTIFIPDAALPDVIAMARDVNNYPKWFAPTIVQAHLLDGRADRDRYTVRYVRKVLFVSAVVEIEYETTYIKVNSTRWYSICRTTRLHEIDRYEKPENQPASDDGTGYVWSILCVSRYQQRDNGVYIEQENVTLSRPIPPLLRWIVEPVVKRLAAELLANSLEQSRQAVVARRTQ